MAPAALKAQFSSAAALTALEKQLAGGVDTGETGGLQRVRRPPPRAIARGASVAPRAQPFTPAELAAAAEASAADDVRRLLARAAGGCEPEQEEDEEEEAADAATAAAQAAAYAQRRAGGAQTGDARTQRADALLRY
jgi:hypothetical protein